MISLSKIESHVNDFEKWLEKRGYRHRSADTYGNTVKRFLEVNPWGDEYKYSDIVDYFGRLSKTCLNITTRKTILIAMKRYYEYLVYIKQRKDNPCGGFHLKGGKDKGLIPSDLFSMEDMEQLINRTEGWGKQQQRNKLIFSLYVYQGLTTEEISRLSLTSVDIDNGLINIKGGKKRNPRVLELHPRQYTMVYKYIHEERGAISHKKSPSAFILNQYGNASSHDSISDTILPVRETYPGRQLCPVSIRMSVMSYWINILKIPIEEVQMLAGIRWVSSIERYQHISAIEEQEVLKMFHPMG